MEENKQAAIRWLYERFKNFYRGDIRKRSLRDAEYVVTRATAPHSCAARVKREEPDPLWQPSFI